MVWLKCWASTHPEYPASIIDWKQMQKIKKPPFTVNYLWGEPSLIDLFILMMPPLPQIWLSAFPACSWGPFSSEGGPAELRSCNFRACKYFTGNDCGKPRKWHRLSSTLYIFSKNHTLLSAPTVGCVVSPMTFYRLFAQTGELLTLDYRCSKFPSQQSNTCLLFLSLD